MNTDNPIVVTYQGANRNDFKVGDITKVNDGRIMLITKTDISSINRQLTVWYKEIYFSKNFIIRYIQKKILNSIIKIKINQ